MLEEGQTFETPKEYYDFVREKDPNYLKAVEKDLILGHIAPTLDEWIDWESNTCHFDDGTFEAMLEFCNEGAESWKGQNVLTYTDLFLFQGFKKTSFASYFEGLFTDAKEAKEYLANHPDANPEKLPDSSDDVWAWVAIPLPSAVHERYEISVDHYYSVVDKEESREASKEFLKWFFLEDVIGEIAPDDPEADYLDCELKGIFNFSINQAECERFVGRNLSWDGENKETRLPVEQRWYEDTRRIIHQADHLQFYRNAVFDVMAEEAYRYFAGDITVKQAADYVQNRISLYLAEQS